LGLVVAVALFGLSGCATTPAGRGAAWEPWSGRLTGGVEGDLELFLTRFAEGEGVHLVEGRFAGDVEGGFGGYGRGTVDGTVAGKFKDGIFDLHLRGEARLSGDVALVNGKMTGTMSQATAFGTWYMAAQNEEHSHRLSGEWAADQGGHEPQGE
jgi:hypothetical protein